jgi:hypothetical protein
VTRYRWVAAPKAEGFPITAACKVAKVSTTAFDDWRRREAAGPTDAAREEAALVEVIREIHAETDGTYGEPRMTPELRARGWDVNTSASSGSCGPTASSACTSRRRSARPSRPTTRRRCRT